jgi:hypothetical protein
MILQNWKDKKQGERIRIIEDEVVRGADQVTIETGKIGRSQIIGNDMVI